MIPPQRLLLVKNSCSEKQLQKGQKSSLADGKTLISGSDDNPIRLWDTGTGRQLRAFAEKLNGLWAMALSPDGRRLATVQDWKTLRIWDTAIGREVGRYTGPDNSCYCPVFSPDGRTLASGGLDGAVQLWDADTGKKRRRWASSQDPVSRLAFSPDGRSLAVGGSGMIRFREAETGKDLLALPGPSEQVTSLVFGDDSKTLTATRLGGVVGRWEAATGKELSPSKLPPDGFHASPRIMNPPVLSRDGQKVAAVDRDGAIWIWEAATGRRISRFSGQPRTRSLLSFSPDGKLVAAAQQDRMIHLWDAATGRQLLKFGLGRELEVENDLAFSPDGKTLAASYSLSVIRLWDVTTGKERRLLRWPAGIASCLAFSPDGRTLASGHLPDMERRPSGKADPLLRVWDVATGRELRRLTGPWYATWSVAFSPDGKTLAWGAYTHTVHLWELASGQERGRFEGHRGAARALAFAPDDRLLASGGSDRTAVVWDVTALSPEGSLPSIRLSLSQVKRLWEELASADASRAYRAMWRLVAAAQQTVPFLQEHLRPVAAKAGRQLAQLLADLDSDHFARRKQATAELEKLGTLAEPALLQMLGKPRSLEARQRLELLLDRARTASTAGAMLRPLRALEVLEQIGTPEARRVLQALAGGAPEARLTQEAQAILRRLGRQPTATP